MIREVLSCQHGKDSRCYTYAGCRRFEMLVDTRCGGRGHFQVFIHVFYSKRCKTGNPQGEFFVVA